MLESLLYGDAVFETLRVLGGRVLAVERHLTRMERTCQKLEFSRQRTKEALEAIENLSREADGMWRVTVSRDADLFGDYQGGVLKTFREYTRPQSPELVTLSGYYFPDDTWAEIKSTSYIRNMEARRAAMNLGADDALMVSQDGRVGEASTSNCFVVFGETIVTPSIQGILPGTRRAAALELLAVDVRPLMVEELKYATGVVLSSSIGFRAAKSLDGRQLDQSVIEAFERCEGAL